MSLAAYFATLLDCAPDALLVFDEHSVIQYVNKQSERMFGYPQAELLRSPMTVLVPSGLSRLPSAGAPFTLTVQARHKAGRRILVEAALARCDLAHGPVFTAACRSRSQLLQLPDASRGKSELLSSMSHELRSPLNVIIGFAKLMYKKRVGEVSDAQREYLGDILDSAEHMLEMINDLVALAKLEAGKIELQPEPLQLSLLLHELTEAVESLARAKNITLSLTAPHGHEHTIEHDPDKLRQLLLNVLSYALRVAPEASSLQLQAHAHDADHVRVAITGGSGLAADCALCLADGGLRSVLTERLAEHIGARIASSSEQTSLNVVLPRVCATNTVQSVRRA